MYALHLQTVGKPLVNFLLVIIGLLSLALTAEILQTEICPNQRFLKGVGHSERKF